MYNPLKHHRRSIRLEGYDYSKPGFYFVTVSSYDQMPIFGKIMNGTFYPGELGTIIQNRWLQIPDFFDKVILHDFVVMPNHIHGILEITGEFLSSQTADIESLFDQRSWKDNFIDTKITFKSPSETVGSFVRGFKYGVSVDYKNLKGKSGKLFQRDYFEEIIKDYGAFLEIKTYIGNNIKDYDSGVGE